MFQTEVANIPKSITIKGAIFVGVDDETGLNTWKWKMLRPTDLRQDSHYIKVLLYIKSIIEQKNWFCRFQPPVPS
jgi:hypothetical protein